MSKIANLAVIIEKEIQNLQNELLEVKVSLTDALERVDALLLQLTRSIREAEREPICADDEPAPEPELPPVEAPVEVAPLPEPEPEPIPAVDTLNDDEITDAVEETDEEEEDDEPTSVQHRSASAIVFTLNDRFRFRRELFGNSEGEMAETVNLLSAMASMSEVEDYLFNDLEWDADNQEVQDFLAIVARKFTDRPPLLG